MDRHLNRLNLEIKRLEEDGQIIPLPTANAPNAETNGTATPNSAAALPPAQSAQPGTSTPSLRAPLPVRTVSTAGTSNIPPPSQLGTPTPSGTASSRKRKATTAFRRDSSVDEVAADEDSQVYCFCQQVSFGEMVACDNEACEKEWFHLPCVGLTSPPQGKWYCEECMAKMTQKQRGAGEKKKVGK